MTESKSLPKIVADNLQPLILDPRDQALLRRSEGLEVTGSMRLPSGLELAAPVEGKMWRVKDGIVELVEIY